MKRALLFASVLALTACAPEQPENYETDTVDESGGDLIVEDATTEGVDVNLPETEMTNAPEESGSEAAAPAE